MSNTTLGEIIVLIVVIFCTFVAWRRRTFRLRIEEAERQQRLCEQEHQAREARERQVQEQHSNTRREARERARIAYPELLEVSEVEGLDPIGPSPEISGSDYELIVRARDLLFAEKAAIEAADPSIRHLGYSGADPNPLKDQWQELCRELSELDVADKDAPPCGKASLYLVSPARIVDCGEAGRINLFTAEQIEAALKESGVADYTEFLRCQADAPILAREIIERVRLAEQKKHEAKEAHIASITTRLEDLPPLPRDKS